MRSNKLPKRLQKYFWDVDIDQLNMEKNGDFILKRVLEQGETQDILWLKQKFTLNDFRQVLRKYRDFSRKTALFWALILNLKSSEVKCLQIPYRQIPYGV